VRRVFTRTRRPTDQGPDEFSRLGKRALGLRLVDNKTGNRIGLLRGFLRAWLLALELGLTCLTVSFVEVPGVDLSLGLMLIMLVAANLLVVYSNARRRGIHDVLVNSIAVHADALPPKTRWPEIATLVPRAEEAHWQGGC